MTDIKDSKLGPTGEYPRGKLHKDDEGGLNCGVAVIDGVVYLDFGGTPVTWLALSKDDTIALIRLLIDLLKKSEQHS
jgi:hypothetical protein